MVRMSVTREDAAGNDVDQSLESREYSVGEILKERGVSRRDFLKFCSVVTSALALPVTFEPRVAEALDKIKRPPLVWMEFQDCAGDSEALLRSANPTVAEI